MKKICCTICGKYRKNIEYHAFSKKALVLSIIFSKYENQDENIFKEEESIKVLKILGLIKNI